MMIVIKACDLNLDIRIGDLDKELWLGTIKIWKLKLWFGIGIKIEIGHCGQGLGLRLGLGLEFDIDWKLPISL